MCNHDNQYFYIKVAYKYFNFLGNLFSYSQICFN